jgi:hypothetical protein
MAISGLEKSADKEQTLLVWDADGSPPVGDWMTVLWRQYAGVKDSGVISIPELVEQEADGLRAH